MLSEHAFGDSGLMAQPDGAAALLDFMCQWGSALLWPSQNEAEKELEWG